MFPVLPKTLAVDLMLNTTGDEWIRYAFNNWIIWTEKPAPEIDALVRRQLARDDQVLIIALNIEERAGLASPWVWEWLDARKKSQVPTLNDILMQTPGIGGSLGLGNPSGSLNALRDLVIGPSNDRKR
jgi:hypothetical protein